MSIVGPVGIALIPIIYFLVLPRKYEVGRLFLVCSALHVAATFLYWAYSLNNPADSKIYYFDSYGMAGNIRSGTSFLVSVVAYMRRILGGSYLEYFMLFQAFGLAGIALSIRSLMEILDDLGERPTFIMLSALFAPGLHFWTCAIGKDGPLFLSVSMAVWAMIKPERRYIAFASALLIMVSVRPHVAAISVVSFVASLIFDHKIRPSVKAAMSLVAIAAGSWALATARATLSLESLDLETVGEFIASKQDYGARSAEGAVLRDLPFPLKVASLLFRPLFFDAKGMLGIIVSLENVALFLVFGYIVLRRKDLVVLARNVVYFRYCIIFSATMITLLSLVTYNVGLGLRQKFMVMPAILMIFWTLIAFRRACAGSEPDQIYEQAPDVI